MARYTCSFTTTVDVESLRQMLAEVFKSCNLVLMCDKNDYMMAREHSGAVSFSKLVTVEVLIDNTTASETAARMKLIIKNDELALQVDNHCRRIFDLINRAIVEKHNWHLVEIAS